MKNFSDANLNYDSLNPEKTDYYKSGRIKVDHIEEEQEIKASIPLQVRINGGEWVDIRALDPEN